MSGDTINICYLLYLYLKGPQVNPEGELRLNHKSHHNYLWTAPRKKKHTTLLFFIDGSVGRPKTDYGLSGSKLKFTLQ